MTDLRMAVVGAAGRMGQALIRATAATPGFVLASAVERAGSPALGQDAALLAGLSPTGVIVGDDPETAFAAADAVLDFTIPSATVAFAALAAKARIAHVVGTTGLSDADMDALRQAAAQTAIVQSGNMSLGVNVLAALVRSAAALLGDDYDIEIVEMHHRQKIDAPSGTALLLGQAAAEGRKIALAERSVRVRDGHTGPRPKGDIGFATLRGGTVVGEHGVFMAGEGERIELWHRAERRENFATGALKAAGWARGQAPGLYTMADVLGL
jgi:4-hydroxy-tetrahydrodipicolinate reductase